THELKSAIDLRVDVLVRLLGMVLTLLTVEQLLQLEKANKDVDTVADAEDMDYTVDVGADADGEVPLVDDDDSLDTMHVEVDDATVQGTTNLDIEFLDMLGD
ncbi:hypothetical protein HDU76_007212, partial [Blyttiomyces sp. JEL0837]